MNDSTARPAHLTAICGGIGSGKSVVSRILSSMGYEVYDCDQNAKLLMDSSENIKERLAAEIAAEVITKEGTIDRRLLSSIVFDDEVKLAALNSIVHQAVLEHMLDWRSSHDAETRLFVESAILYQSGLYRYVDDIWEVSAPDEIRIQRVMQRNDCTRQQVEKRIQSQNAETALPRQNCRTIINDGLTPILPQILGLLVGHSTKIS